MRPDTTFEPLASTTRAGEIALGVHPDTPARILRAGMKDLASYRACGGYAAGRRGSDLLDVIEESGLRGRGGAAFPTAVKLRSVANRPAPRYAVANGEEGEPTSVKDRWLLQHRPHLVLDGLLRVCDLLSAAGAYVYVSDAGCAATVEGALAEWASSPLPIQIHRVDRGYVAGEETAVVRALNGGPAKPTDKPPRPFEHGVDDAPTVVSNVETLANVALLAVEENPSADSFLLTISGACSRPGLYEVPYGAELGTTTELVAGADPQARGYLMGGFFAGLLAPRGALLPLDIDALRDRGSGLGCGAIVVLGQAQCPVAAASEVMAYFARENADQCGSCIRGTGAMSAVLTDLRDGTATRDQLDRMRKWSTTLPGRGACGTLDGAAKLAASVLTEFATEVDAHLATRCTTCTEHPLGTGETRFAVNLPSPMASGVQP